MTKIRLRLYIRQGTYGFSSTKWQQVNARRHSWIDYAQERF